MAKIFFVIFLCYFSLLADWNILRQGKIKGNIDDLFIFGSSIYIGGDCLYRASIPVVSDFEKIYSQDFINFSANNKRIFAIRYKDDEIYYSDNYGISWESIKYGGKSIYWKEIFTVNDSVTIAVGDTIAKTIDDGNTWFIWADGLQQIDNYTFYDLYFQNENTGVVVGKNRDNNKFYIFRTNDNGQSWDTVYISSKTSYNKVDLFFVNSSRGWISFSTSYGCDSIYMTNDSGKTWEGLYYYKDNDLRPTKLFFVSNDTGFAIGKIRSPSKPALMKTVDGGHNWYILDTLQYNPIAIFVENNIVYIGCYYGILEKYENNELINLSLKSESFEYTWVVNGSNKTTFFIGNYSDYSILKTTDIGSNFSDIETPFKPYRIYFFNDFSGIGVSSSGKKIYYTDDGGNSWEYFSNSFSKSWRDIIFLNDTIGWLLGDSIIQTNNSGKKWFDISNRLPTNIMLRKGCIVKDKIYLCGYDEINKSAIILVSEDTCKSFTTLYNSSGYAYYIYFVNTKVGYCSNKYRLLKTVDSGITWDTVYTFPTSEYIYAIYFYNNDIGWVGTDEGFIYNTLYGGASFVKEIEHDDHINHFFYANNTLFATGDNGFIARRNLDSVYVILDKGWHLVSFPLNLFDNTFNNISDDITPFYNSQNNSNIYIWKEGISGYVVPDNLINTQAYFIYIWQDSTVLDFYGELVNNDNFIFDITKSSNSEYCGLNLIPNPYNDTIDFQLIYSNSDIDNKYWIWTDSGYAFYPNGGRSNLIYPTEAFWVCSKKENGSLVISKPYDYVPKMNKSNFNLLWRIKIVQDSIMDANNFLGIYKNASDSLDLYDMQEVPSLKNSELNLYFINNGQRLMQCVNRNSMIYKGTIQSTKLDTVKVFFYPVVSNGEKLVFNINNTIFDIYDTSYIEMIKDDTIVNFDISIEGYTKFEENEVVIRQNEIICFPNPCKDYLYIKNNTGNKYDLLYIYDATGMLLLKTDINLVGNSIKRIDYFAKFSSGIYFIRLRGKHIQKKLKIVKVR